jgi:hypothetical protein
MKANSNSNATLSIKAIAAKARNAAALAAVAVPVTGTKNRWSSAAPSIEQRISMIFETLKAYAGDANFKLNEPARGASCKGIICVYPEADKKCETTPIEKYVFYPNRHDLSKIGSVAIYGKDADLRCMQILKRGTLFGYSVASAKVEMGRRQFVDVTLVA